MNFIKDMTEGERVSQVFLMRGRKVALSKAGKPYENVILQDKTGTLDGKIWEPDSPGIDEADAPAYVHVSGDVSNYMGKLQISIKRLREANENEYNEADYLPVSPYPIDQMYEKLLDCMHTVENKDLRRLLESFFEDETFAKSFKFHSAAKSVHHGFVGGLLQHTLHVTTICENLSKMYPILNHDLLISAAMCHDIGKLKELSVFPENDYTDDGQLLGHIVIGLEMIGRKIDEIDGFSPRLASELKHCIVAHHGEYEFGSPKKPGIVEACALNLADNMDAKMEIFTEVMNGANSNSYEWLGFNRFLDSNIRRTYGE